ncbi:MAG: thiosulfate oxidation carrier complex protein SoxZ [Thiocapsa sp.]|nr:thiosulfate oxidation carrier complex protein SoxZ [Thiocapsa sp.]MCG6985390.1 thiosulfate oxidation carrier complex protein SoxZ [Thiocapsa sp.]
MASEDTGRIRARLKDGLVNVKVLMRHPMETGSRKHPATGALLPRHFIREVVCEHNGSAVLTLDWGWGVAADPYLSFDILDGKAGDSITVRWEDNQGASGRLETEVR